MSTIRLLDKVGANFDREVKQWRDQIVSESKIESVRN